MNTSITEVKELMNKVVTLKNNMPWNYGRDERDILKTCEILEILGWEWGHQVQYNDFRITQDYYISPSNQAKKYKPQKDEWFIVWDNGNIGRLQFVADKYWYAVEDEWKDFRQKLMAYEPLDYDLRNDQMIYSIENGKKLLEDYEKICNETRETMRAKIKQVEMKEAKDKYEKLLKEMAGDSE